MSELVDVAAALQARTDAEGAFVASLRTARDAGNTLQAIADVCGMTRAGVLYLLRKHDGQGDEARMVARLAELDDRWERFIDGLAEAFTSPDAKREQLRRNAENGKARRKHARADAASAKRGFRGVARVALVPTVKSEGRRFAETYALSYVEKNPGHPVVARVLAELDEAAALREKLTTLHDARVPFLHD